MAKKLTSASAVVKKHNHDDLYYGKKYLDNKFTAINGSQKELRSYASTFDWLTVDFMQSDRRAFMPREQVTVERSLRGQNQREPHPTGDNNVRNLFSQEIRTGLAVDTPKEYDIRITIDSGGTMEQSSERYHMIKKLFFWGSPSGHKVALKIERATVANPDTWITVVDFDTKNLYAGWPGPAFIEIPKTTFGNFTGQGHNNKKIRLTFTVVEEIAGDYNFRLYSIRAYGDEYYSSQVNNLPMVTGRPYRYDFYGNIEFPKGVKVPDPIVDGDAVNKKYLKEEIKKVADKIPNAIVNQRDTTISAKAWVGTQAQKSAVTTPDPYTIYYVIEE